MLKSIIIIIAVISSMNAKAQNSSAPNITSSSFSNGRITGTGTLNRSAQTFIARYKFQFDRNGQTGINQVSISASGCSYSAMNGKFHCPSSTWTITKPAANYDGPNTGSGPIYVWTTQNGSKIGGFSGN